MGIRNELKEAGKNIKDAYIQHHSKEHRREISQKITNKLGLQEVVNKARAASDEVKNQVGKKVSSQAKLVERSLLKLDAETHKKLLSDDITVWSNALAGKSVEQIGKYLDRAAEAENLKWPSKKDKELSYNLKTVFQSGDNPYDFAWKKIEEVTSSKTARGKGREVSLPDVETLEKLAHVYCESLIKDLDLGPKAAKKTFLERVQRNSKTDVAVIGKRLEVLGKALQQKAVRLPSSAIHGVANTAVAGPVVGGGAALIAGSVGLLVATHGLIALPVMLALAAPGLGLGSGAVALGTGLMVSGSTKGKESSTATSEAIGRTSSVIDDDAQTLYDLPYVKEKE